MHSEVGLCVELRVQYQVLQDLLKDYDILLVINVQIRQGI
jgi:hypothetical protein